MRVFTYIDTFLFAILFMPLDGIGARLNVTSNLNLTSSPWLKRVTNPRVQAQAGGCWNRPWVCSFGQFPPRRLCCMNRCVDITSDNINCGICGARCPFGWQCCRGACIDINSNPFHCGRCLNRCPLGRPCTYGMCGYAGGGGQPAAPFPFPLPPILPDPPFPFPFPPVLPLPPSLPLPPGLGQPPSLQTRKQNVQYK